jgi:hypothetical protein
MLTVKGFFQNGVAHPTKPIEGRDGQQVMITFLEEDIETYAHSEENSAWDKLTELVEDCAAETGIEDLAHQHDHYLYNNPKRN